MLSKEGGVFLWERQKIDDWERSTPQIQHWQAKESKTRRRRGFITVRAATLTVTVNSNCFLEIGIWWG
jgi:hypothetical protein